MTRTEQRRRVKTITISISGQRGLAKPFIAYAIRKVLKEKGYACRVIQNEDSWMEEADLKRLRAGKEWSTNVPHRVILKTVDEPYD